MLTVRPNQAKSKAAESTSLSAALIVFIELVLSQLGKGANFVELGVTPRVCCAHLSGADGAAALLRAGARIDDRFPHVSHGALPPDLFVAAGRDHFRRQRAVEILPHRYPFALVDRILDYEPGQWAIGRKCVTRNEEFFCGHFPGQPVMPGVLILEALAQTGAVAALSLPENKGKLALFGGIKNARFRKQVTPGDVLTLHCELVEQRGPVGIGKASAYVDGKCAATAELTFVLT